MTILDGDVVLREATLALGINLADLVARTSLWASRDTFARVGALRPNAVWFPNVRRYRLGERRRDVVDGVTLDDNTFANRAAKLAILGDPRSTAFSVCHVWPGTCYDIRYHTSVANLILVPTAIAGLTDHDEHVCATIRYRAYELYGWHPSDKAAPDKPAGYPTFWAPFPDSQDRVGKRVSGLESRF